MPPRHPEGCALEGCRGTYGHSSAGTHRRSGASWASCEHQALQTSATCLALCAHRLIRHMQRVFHSPTVCNILDMRRELTQPPITALELSRMKTLHSRAAPRTRGYVHPGTHAPTTPAARWYLCALLLHYSPTFIRTRSCSREQRTPGGACILRLLHSRHASSAAAMHALSTGMSDSKQHFR